MRLFKVSDRFAFSAEVVGAGNAAIGLWTLAGSWAAVQDSPCVPTVPSSVLRYWASTPQPLADRLVRVGLWEPQPAGWDFVPHDHLYAFQVPPPWRPAIPDVLRQRVYVRDGYACLHCGTSDSLSLDHIYPWSLGGQDTYDNLQTLCTPCNSRKGARV